MKWTRFIIIIAVLAIVAGAALLPFAHDFGDWQLIGPFILIPAGLLLLIAVVVFLVITRGYRKKSKQYHLKKR